MEKFHIKKAFVLAQIINKNMKKMVIFTLVLLVIGVNAQSLADSSLEQFARNTLVEGIKEYGDDVNQAGAVIMHVNTGNVIANVCIGQYREVKDIPSGNSEAIPCGIGRAVLYLSMLDYLKPSFLVETGDGLYVDSISGCTITDMSYDHGGFGTLTLQRAFDVSDVGIIKAAEIAFKRNMNRFGGAVRKTGVFFENPDDETNEYREIGSRQMWSPCDIIGYRSPYSLLLQTAWVNMVANGGKLLMRLDENDPITPVCEIKNKTGLDSLAVAMLETVECGTGINMRSRYMRVAGLVNVSPADVINCRGCFAAAFFPYEKPRYTVGVYVNKHDDPVERAIAAKIAGRIIDHMANYMLVTESKPYKYHPAEK